MTIVCKFDEPRGGPVGKLADAELHFSGGLFDGLKLIGFSVWERRTGGGINVTFPARQYSVNGERRSFALLRPTGTGNGASQDRIRDYIVDAWRAYQVGGGVTITREADEVPAAVMPAPGMATGYADLGAALGLPDVVDDVASVAVLDVATLAASIWAGLDANERHGVLFGLFPMKVATAQAAAKLDAKDSHAVTCELMRLAAEGSRVNVARPTGGAVRVGSKAGPLNF